MNIINRIIRDLIGMTITFLFALLVLTAVNAYGLAPYTQVTLFDYPPSILSQVSLA